MPLPARSRVDPNRPGSANQPALGRGWLRLLCLVFMVWLGASRAAGQDESSWEFWPETDIWLRLSPEWRLSMFLPISQNIETKYREGNLILQADYAWGKSKHVLMRRMVDENRVRTMRRFLVRGGYLSGKSLGDQGETYNEDMALLEFHLRTPFKGRVLVSHRLRSEARWLGDDHEFSTRFRYRLMIERDFEVGRTSIVPYVNVEPYYDSRYKTVNRVRLIGGATVTRWRFFALEVNITYQHDSRSSVTNLYALNVILHLYFETARARKD